MKETDIYDVFCGIDEKYCMDSEDFEDIANEFKRAKIRKTEKVISFAVSLTAAVVVGVNIHDMNIFDKSELINPSSMTDTSSSYSSDFDSENNVSESTEVSKQSVKETHISSINENTSIPDSTKTKPDNTYKTSVKSENNNTIQSQGNNSTGNPASSVQTKPNTTKPSISQTDTPTKPNIPDTTNNAISTSPKPIATNKPHNTTPTSQKPTTTVTSDEFISEPQWDEKTISEQFCEFTAANITYAARDKKINADSVGGKISNIIIEGHDVYENKTHYANAEMYKIKNISDNCAIAVKFQGYDTYYSYTNINYFPNTLGDLIDSLDLNKTISFGSMYLENGTEIENYDRGNLYSLLNANRNSTFISDYSAYDKKFSFSTSIDLLGIYSKSLIVTNDGYITTNIMEWGYTFYIGEEAVKALSDSLGINYDEVQTKPIPTGQEDIYPE